MHSAEDNILLWDSWQLGQKGNIADFRNSYYLIRESREAHQERQSGGGFIWGWWNRRLGLEPALRFTGGENTTPHWDLLVHFWHGIPDKVVTWHKLYVDLWQQYFSPTWPGLLKGKGSVLLIFVAPAPCWVPGIWWLCSVYEWMRKWMMDEP